MVIKKFKHPTLFHHCETHFSGVLGVSNNRLANRFFQDFFASIC